VYVYGGVSLNSSQNEKCFEVVEKIKTHFSFSAILPENRTIYEIIWKNIIETDWPHDNVMWRRKDRICMWVNQSGNADTRAIFIVKTMRNNLQLDNSAKRIYCCISMEILNTYC
jgi:hypothetical protein